MKEILKAIKLRPQSALSNALPAQCRRSCAELIFFLVQSRLCEDLSRLTRTEYFQLACSTRQWSFWRSGGERTQSIRPNNEGDIVQVEERPKSLSTRIVALGKVESEAATLLTCFETNITTETTGRRCSLCDLGRGARVTTRRTRRGGARV